MNSRGADLSGKRFGLLTILELASRPKETTQTGRFWLCRCVCGKEIVVRGTSLYSGHTTCCGCDGVDRAPVDNGDGSFNIALPCGNHITVDAADLPLVTRFRWRSSPHLPILYAVTGKDKGRRYLHRLLTGRPHVDHIDGNGLNNRRANLRPATNSQNQGNRHKTRVSTSSRYKGVCYHKQTAKWVVYARGMYIGLFADEVEAARAYDAAATRIWGEYARLNFPC